MSRDATVALGEFVPSPDGKLLAYSLSDGGTDWRTWHVRDVATRQGSARRAALHQVSRGRRGRPIRRRCTTRAIRSAPMARAMIRNRCPCTVIAGHRRRTRIKLVYAITDHPTRYPYPHVSDDGRYLILNVYDGSQSTGIYYQKLDAQAAADAVRSCDSSTRSMPTTSSSRQSTTCSTCARRGAPNSRLIAVPARSRRCREGARRRSPRSDSR